MEIFEKRGRWCFRDSKGTLFKFATKEEAEIAIGIECEDCECDPCECATEELDGSEEEEESREEEASTYE